VAALGRAHGPGLVAHFAAPPRASGRSYLVETRLSTRGERPPPAPAGQPRLIERLPLLHTTQGSYPRYAPSSYQVKSGDTLEAIAARFGLEPATVFWANQEQLASLRRLPEGLELTILPFDGAYHTVAAGETVASIAAHYQVPPQSILDYPGNDITDALAPSAGQKLIVPGAALPDVPPPPPAHVQQEENAEKGTLIWPVGGIITTYYRAGHEALDIAGPPGDPVVAAKAGTVALVAWPSTGYGHYVIIDHGGGLQTLYAHLSEINVEVGQSVAQGEEIGTRGTTGHSTGPHLHFEVRQGSAKRDPLNYLP